MEHLLGAEGPLIEKEEQDQEIRTLRKVPVPPGLSSGLSVSSFPPPW